jgi:hypothetical protein
MLLTNNVAMYSPPSVTFAKGSYKSTYCGKYLIVNIVINNGEIELNFNICQRDELSIIINVGEIDTTLHEMVISGDVRTDLQIMAF